MSYKVLKNGFVDENTLRETIQENIKTIIDKTNLNRAQLAAKTGIAPATLTSYLNPKESKIPPVAFLMNICLIDEVRQLWPELTVNDLISPDFDTIPDAGGAKKSVYDSFIGAYDCYFFDQSKPVTERESLTSRDLRFGVIAVFDDDSKRTGRASYEALAKFFKLSEREEAVLLKNKVESCYGESAQNISERNAKIRGCFNREPGFYEGSVNFSETHAFLSLTGKAFNDTAMMVFYVPQKRLDQSYVGGLGAVCSVTHGRNHMPAAQKIILSKSRLHCSDAVIAKHLSLSSASIELGSQAKLLTEICTKLFGSGTQLSFLDDSDKSAIVTGRLNQLVTDYIQNSIFSVGTVSLDEDMQVYNLIKKYS